MKFNRGDTVKLDKDIEYITGVGLKEKGTHKKGTKFVVLESNIDNGEVFYWLYNTEGKSTLVLSESSMVENVVPLRTIRNSAKALILSVLLVLTPIFYNEAHEILIVPTWIMICGTFICRAIEEK